MSVTVTLVTCKDRREAEKIARALVTEKLAACVNVVPGVTSVYSWKGKLCRDHEAMLIIKSTARRFDALRKRVVALHSYSVPEIISMRVARGHAAYLKWVAREVLS